MVIVSDFDGTLYPHGAGEQFWRNLGAVRKFREAGNEFCLATGRNMASLGRVWPEYGDYLDYAILDNGAVCIDSREKVLFEYVIQKDLAKEICDDVMKRFAGEVAFVYYCDAREWLELGDRMTKMRCWVTSNALSGELLTYIHEKYADVVQAFLVENECMLSVDWISDRERYRAFVDMMAIEAGKEKMIRRLGLEDSRDGIITVGDGMNDVGMLKEYDGYTIADAKPEVIKAVGNGKTVKSVEELIEREMSAK